MNTFTSRVVLAGAGAATIAALALGAGAAANAATSSASPSASSATATTGVPFRAISATALRAEFGSVPSSLRTDLEALHGKKGSDRKTAVEAIERKALDGGYGDTVKSAATAAQTAWKDAPAAMRKDLRDARHAEGADREKALAAVATKALDGGYGAAEQQYAKQVQGTIQKQDADSLARHVGAIV